MCPRTLSDRYDQTETDRALWFFSYWTTTDKTKFTAWSQVDQKFDCWEIGNFWQRMMKVPPLLLIRVKVFRKPKSYRKKWTLFLTHYTMLFGRISLIWTKYVMYSIRRCQNYKYRHKVSGNYFISDGENPL